MRISSLSGAAAALIFASLPAQAQSPAEFYNRKNVRMLVGYGPGTGFDVYARAVARHMGRHIPGQPNMVVENMPGAGGMTMANYLYNVAAKDGTAIGLVVNVFMEPLFKNEAVRFDVKKYTWLGSVSRSTPLCFTWHTSGITRFEDVRTKETLVGATGRFTDSYLFPQLINDFLGMKFKPVTGYPDSAAIGIAMERGELQGFCSFTYASVKSARPEWLSKKQINILVQLGLSKNPELPDVPMILDLVKEDTAKQIMTVMASNWEAARPIGGPPGIPQDRFEALRKAFMDTMKDTQFLAETSKLNIEVDPLDGPAVEKVLDRLYDTPQPVIDRMIAIRAKDY